MPQDVVKKEGESSCLAASDEKIPKPTEPRIKRARVVKSKDCNAALELVYQKTSIWPRKLMIELGKQLGITRVKVYKWHYDRKFREKNIVEITLREEETKLRH